MRVVNRIRNWWNELPIGTRSILLGAHCFFIHPWFVALAWWKLYGFPSDYRLWAAFFLHDIGYWGKPNMDGEEGEKHVEKGAELMGRLFDHDEVKEDLVEYGCYGSAVHETFINSLQTLKAEGRMIAVILHPTRGKVIYRQRNRQWENFTRYHSRFYAKNDGINPSPLCAADKLALYLTPWWLYLPMIRFTGEIKEYMELSKSRTAAGEPKYSSQKLSTDSEMSWCFDVQEYARRWAMEHADGRPDTWTPKMAQS